MRIHISFTVPKDLLDDDDARSLADDLEEAIGRAFADRDVEHVVVEIRAFARDEDADRWDVTRGEDE